jgi:LysM repeat protein
VILAAISVAVIVLGVVALLALKSHLGNATSASPSAPSAATYLNGSSGSFVASISSIGTDSIGAPASPSIVGGGTESPSGPQPSYRQYKVQAGDTLTRIATKFRLKTWELLLANPNLAANAGALRIGMIINVPVPGQMTPATAAPANS